MRFTFEPVIACELAPNYQLDDALLAAALIIAPYPITLHTPQLQVKKWLATYLTGYADETQNKIWLLDSGRTALYLLLNTLNLPKGSEVLLQAFSCVVVPNAILQAGLKPVLCDINKETYNFDHASLEAKITEKTKVIIVQHTYGIMDNMEAIAKIANKYNLLIIEDCAHSLGSQQVSKKEQKNAGSFGHAAIFSFGRDKIVSSTVGGAAVINIDVFQKMPKTRQAKVVDPYKWADDMELEYDLLPNMSVKSTLQSLFYPLLTTFLVRPLYSLNVGKAILLFAQKTKIAADVYTKAEAEGTNMVVGGSKYSSRLACSLLNQLKKFPLFKTHRDKLAAFYATEFESEYNPDTMYLRYPLNIETLLPAQKKSKKKQKIEFKELWFTLKRRLQNRSILMGTWYTNIFLPQQVQLKKFGYKKGSLPNAEELVDYRIINLPTNINTSKKDAKKVVHLVKEILADADGL